MAKMAPSATSPEDSTPTTLPSTFIPSLRETLCTESIPLSQRYRALFALKHHACLNPPTELTSPAIEAIAAAFSSPSALLKHEVAYCLGQTRNLECAPALRNVLEDRKEDPMCRHEAAEALGALGDIGSLDLLKSRRDDKAEKDVVRETCEIAVERIEWEASDSGKQEKLKKSDFSSIDPAPPMEHFSQTPPSIPELQATLLDTSLPLFTRYRAMFGLRDLASPPTLPTAVPAVHALASGFSDPSALFRHEIAFVFGQLSHPASIPSLIQALSNVNEASMVRHEAAEALGSLGDEEGVEDVLKAFLKDADKVVRDSVIVALDMAEAEKKGELEWAGLPKEEFSPLAAVKA
jgi:deoxyhypusine monooxygenase